MQSSSMHPVRRVVLKIHRALFATYLSAAWSLGANNDEFALWEE
jgi:hypothetical protein